MFSGAFCSSASSGLLFLVLVAVVVGGVQAAADDAAASVEGHIRLDPHLGVTGEHHDVVDLRHEGGAGGGAAGGSAGAGSGAGEERGHQLADAFDISDVNRLSDGFVSSLAMILVSELGDETFIIAAIMAMRNPRYVIYSAAMAALVLMTVLSTALGFVVPNLVNAKLVHHFATFLVLRHPPPQIAHTKWCG